MVTLEDGAATFELEVSDGVAAALVLVEGAPQDVRLSVWRWEAQGGAVVVGEDAGRPLNAADMAFSLGSGEGLAGPCRVRPGHGAVTAGCPNNGTVGLPAGRHVLGLHAVVTRASADGGVGTAQGWDGLVEVWVRLSRPAAAGVDVALPIRVHVPPPADGGVPASSSPGWARSMATLAGLLAPAGLAVQVEEVTAPGVGPVVLSASSLRGPDLDALVGHLDPAPGLDVFVVPALEVVDGVGNRFTVAGLVPNAPVAAGRISVAAPVLVAGGWQTEDPLRDRQLGTRMAHEVGHALGLWHLVEPAQSDGGTVVDPLEDTPQSPAMAPDWLMHHFPQPASTQLSPLQAEVMRNHPNTQ